MYKQPEFTRAEAFAALEKEGAVKAVLPFSGGGDSGGVDSIQLIGTDGEVIRTVEPYYGGYQFIEGQGFVQSPAPPEKEYDTKLGNTLSKPVFDKYHSFAGEFYVDGTVTWDVATKTVRMDGQETVDSYLDLNEEL